MTTEARTVTCGQCGDTFESGWSKEEAEAEMRANFGDLDPDDMAVVCDECYEAMTSQLPIADYRAGQQTYTKLEAWLAVEAFCNRRFDNIDMPPAVQEAIVRLTGCIKGDDMPRGCAALLMPWRAAVVASETETP